MTFGTRRVAITGVGTVTALGATWDATWAGLLGGRCGFGSSRRLDLSRWESPLVAEIPEDAFAGDASDDRAIRLAFAAARQALATAPPPGARDAVVVGTTLAGERPESEPPGRVATALARRLGFAGAVRTVSTACASGAAALAEAASLVGSGEADLALAGGVDVLSPFVVSGFASLRALAREAPRPFDAHRDGLGLGEAAAFVTLEAESACARRGAVPLAWLDGWATASDAFHLTRPDPEGRGLVRACQAALAAAGAAAGEVDFVSAHGTATVFNDAMEGAAFRALLGPRAAAVPVHSAKGAVGHTLGAAGALEAILAARVLAERRVPPTAGLREFDARLGIDVVRGAPRVLGAGTRLALSTNSAFGGGNAALVLRRAEAA